ncbi:MAG: family 16 glycosylhydrolase [Flavobacteriaceae bacterium]
MKITNLKCIVALLTVSLFLGNGCTEDDGLPQRSFQLVWEDQFDGTAGSSPDASKWNFDIGTGDNGWGNQELQYYSDRPENIALDGNGNLVITAIAESFQGQPYSSARINTKGLFEQRYGRVEARLKTPFGPGMWPAFWLLGNDIDTVGWPQCGEIDVMELRGQEPSLIHGSVHGPGYSGGDAVTDSFELEDARFDTDFYVYAIEWGENYVEYYVNDRLYQRITPADVPGEWVYDHSFFIILNVAVGGTFVGFPSPTGTRFPQTMVVDYVKVYQEVN